MKRLLVTAVVGLLLGSAMAQTEDANSIMSSPEVKPTTAETKVEDEPIVFPPYKNDLTSCTEKNTLCDFDYKTGLRKHCIMRIVIDVSNPNDADYKNALEIDKDLFRGSELRKCYTSEEAEALMATHNKKDLKTTVTS